MHKIAEKLKQSKYYRGKFLGNLCDFIIKEQKKINSETLEDKTKQHEGHLRLGAEKLYGREFLRILSLFYRELSYVWPNYFLPNLGLIQGLNNQFKENKNYSFLYLQEEKENQNIGIHHTYLTELLSVIDNIEDIEVPKNKRTGKLSAEFYGYLTLLSVSQMENYLPEVLSETDKHPFTFYAFQIFYNYCSIRFPKAENGEEKGGATEVEDYMYFKKALKTAIMLNSDLGEGGPSALSAFFSENTFDCILKTHQDDFQERSTKKIKGPRVIYLHLNKPDVLDILIPLDIKTERPISKENYFNKMKDFYDDLNKFIFIDFLEGRKRSQEAHEEAYHKS